MTRDLLFARFRDDRDKALVATLILRSGPSLEALTQRLEALVGPALEGDEPLELIILDESATSAAPALIGEADYIRCLRASEFTDLAEAMNAAASCALGRYLLLINDSVILHPGAVAAVLRGFALFSDVGIVGLRLLTPEGRLHHAGGQLIGGDVLVALYCEHDEDPERPEANFARDCAYVDGAVFAVDRGFFIEAGGWSATCGTGFHGMVDLCIRCLKVGKRIIYHPQASALLPRAGGVERDTAHRTAFMARNGALLPALATLRAWFAGRDRDSECLRVLYIDDYTPHQDAGAGLPRANSIINIMAEMGYGVTVYPVSGSDPTLAERYRDISPRVELLRGKGADRLGDLIEERPRYYDVIWISRPHNIKVVLDSFLRRALDLRDWVRAAIIFDTEAVFAGREALIGLHAGRSIQSGALREAIRAELAPGVMADAVICVSEPETRLLRHFGGLRNVQVLGHAIAPKPGLSRFEDRAGLVFVGSLLQEDGPNVDSLLWFLDQVWPLVRARLGDNVPFHIVGAVHPALVERFTREQVILTGRIARLDEVFDRARLAIAPTRFAAGVPHKVQDSISLGLPMVITPLLQAQLEWDEGDGFLSASWQSPETFAEAICQLYEDRACWQEVRERGLSRIANECSPDTFKMKLKAICEEATWSSP